MGETKSRRMSGGHVLCAGRHEQAESGLSHCMRGRGSMVTKSNLCTKHKPLLQLRESL